MRGILGHVRGGIFGRLGFQKLVGVGVKVVQNILGGYRRVRDCWKLREFHGVPFGLDLEDLERMLATTC